MHILKRLAAAAIVPVVVLDNVKDAIPTAKALLAGGVDVMEITSARRRLRIRSRRSRKTAPTC